MTRIARALEDDGYVQREHDPTDGRVVRLNATAEGERVLWEGRERRVARLAALLGRLSPQEVARVQEAAELVERAVRES
jgi:DNA-binding MarR family transcriptional regulator